MKYILTLLLILPTLTQAFTTDDALHPVAHGAGSYLITHASEVVCKKVSSLSKPQCTLIGAGIAMAAGAAVELTQEQSKRNALKGIGYDSIGITLAIGVISFDF